MPFEIECRFLGATHTHHEFPSFPTPKKNPPPIPSHQWLADIERGVGSSQSGPSSFAATEHGLGRSTACRLVVHLSTSLFCMDVYPSGTCLVLFWGSFGHVGLAGFEHHDRGWESYVAKCVTTWMLWAGPAWAAINSFWLLWFPFWSQRYVHTYYFPSLLANRPSPK
ncbi:hypothetical protein QBC42DRAFT_47225 [Cladorrhinum samala]|uniref:Uncharacterized protein n=1 Tax=Cladorrhinum samala TaxID=585594 RepID=A0AAV9HD49_9PEZI|nr:hypothetical protein QBC42DRAFT_47225 [Cladorrhinum samala]